MTATLWLRDLGSYALQVAVIVAAGAAVWRVLRVRHAALSYGYWRLLLFVCLLLPLAQPWQASAPAPIVAGTPAPMSIAGDVDRAAMDGVPASSRPRWPVSELLLAGLAAGAAVRGLWLVLGTFSLRRLRRTAQPIDPPPPGIDAARARLDVRAGVCASDRVTGPITFGFRHPIVLLPPGVLSMEPELQEAIVCHELIHVQRRDWLNVIAEEAVRTLFWFHPAMWWLVGRIQLSREHVVDEAVIRLTQSRDRYVEAMLAVAIANPSALPVPATLFLRRRFLKRRVAHILQEVTMTTRRLIASVTFSAAALYVAAALVVRAFPLEARAPEPAQAQRQPAGPVVIARGGEQLLHASLPEYPRRAIQQRVEGEVVLDVTIDERGEVSDARVLSGPDELRRAALESVLQWHYSPEKLRSTSAQVALRFTAPPAGVESEEEVAKYTALLTIRDGEPKEYEIRYKRPLMAVREDTDLLKRQLLELESAASGAGLTDAQRIEYKTRSAALRAQLAHVGVETRSAKAGWNGPLVRIKTERLPELVATEILGRAGVSIGDRLDEAAMKRVRAALSAYDEHLHVGFEQDGKGGLILFIIAP